MNSNKICEVYKYKELSDRYSVVSNFIWRQYAIMNDTDFSIGFYIKCVWKEEFVALYQVSQKNARTYNNLYKIDQRAWPITFSSLFHRDFLFLLLVSSTCVWSDEFLHMNTPFIRPLQYCLLCVFNMSYRLFLERNYCLWQYERLNFFFFYFF